MHKSLIIYYKYKSEIAISILTVLISSVISLVVSLIMKTDDLHFIYPTVMGSTIIILLCAILFNIRRLSKQKFEESNHFSYFHETSTDKYDYFRRYESYFLEKKLLSEVFVEKTLPKIIRMIRADKPNLTKFNMILDSGSMITHIFRSLADTGIKDFGNETELNIYTNNLAGIDAIFNHNSKSLNLSEDNIILIGGKPNRTYRNTSGHVAQNYLDSIWQENQQLKDKSISLSVVYANWFLMDPSYKRLSIAVKGRSEYEFKKDLIDNSNYLIIVCPLGKILRIDDTDELNRIMPHSQSNDKFFSCTLPTDNKNTFLLTTFRPSSSHSPLANWSQTLEYLSTHKKEGNYSIDDYCPYYEPKGERYDIVTEELPHTYIRDQFSKVYGYRIDNI
ncbi:MAG: hypothetical protein ABIK15_10650 [Pseudomonadota bacterium]